MNNSEVMRENAVNIVEGVDILSSYSGNEFFNCMSLFDSGVVNKDSIIDSKSKFVNAIKSVRESIDYALEKSGVEPKDNGSQSTISIEDILQKVNTVVKATLNDGSCVETLDDLNQFLEQAIPAWASTIRNQTVFQTLFPQTVTHV